MPAGPFIVGRDVNYVKKDEKFNFFNPGGKACEVKNCQALLGLPITVLAGGTHSVTVSHNVTPGVNYPYECVCNAMVIAANPVIIVGS